MRVFRVLLVLAGIAMGLWGLWLMRDFRFDQLKSAGIWVVAGIILHDGVLAPIVVAFGALHMKAIPNYARKPVTIALIVWGTLTITVGNVLSGQGGKVDNDTVLNRPYVTNWLLLSLGLAIIVALDIVRRRPRKSLPKVIANDPGES
ncbi:MAG: hypothetical protein ABIR57_04355 [Aeromicrobium sp.]